MCCGIKCRQILFLSELLSYDIFLSSHCYFASIMISFNENSKLVNRINEIPLLLSL